MRTAFHYLLCTLLLLLSIPFFAQEIKVQVLDSTTNEPIPFASIYTSMNNGSIANEDGQIRMIFNSTPKAEDSLFISCMGYKTIGYPVSNFQDSIVRLSPKPIALNSIVLSNKNFTAKEIIKDIQENIPTKYELDFTKKKIFFRESGKQVFALLKTKIIKSSIEELNQKFWDSTLKKVPRKNDWHIEVLGELYGNQREKQKFVLEKALELEDKQTTAIFENIEKAFDTILKQNVKSDSYFKVHIGLLSKKIEDVDFNSTEKDTLSEEEKKVIDKKNFFNSRKSIITQMMVKLFEKEKLNISGLKASKYDYQILDFTEIESTPVYVLGFHPNGNADYSGKIYVDADTMTLIRIEYENIKNIKALSLFGFSFKHDKKRVVLQFKKMNSGKYTPEYLELNNGYEMGVNRPFKIVEKNKNVKGRNKQNELKMDLDLKQQFEQKYQLVVLETLTITQEEFSSINENPNILPVNLTKYDPTFWEGYTIIEPNETIKAFKVEK